MTAPIPTPDRAPLAVRFMQALGSCDDFVRDAPGIDIDWLLSETARHYFVDRSTLAVLWLRRVLAREHARAALASMAGADEEADA